MCQRSLANEGISISHHFPLFTVESDGNIFTNFSFFLFYKKKAGENEKVKDENSCYPYRRGHLVIAWLNEERRESYKV